MEGFLQGVLLTKHLRRGGQNDEAGLLQGSQS